MKRWQRRSIGILTLAGGAVGFTAALGLLLSRTNPIDWLFCIAFIAAYAWGVWCGARLLENARGAEDSAFKYWMIQVPTFGCPIVSYFFSGGFHVTATMQILPLKFNGNFLLGSSFNYSLLQVEQPWFIGINLVAALLAWWLASVIRRSPDAAISEPAAERPPVPDQS